MDKTEGKSFIKLLKSVYNDRFKLPSSTENFVRSTILICKKSI